MALFRRNRLSNERILNVGRRTCHARRNSTLFDTSVEFGFVQRTSRALPAHALEKGKLRQNGERRFVVAFDAAVGRVALHGFAAGFSDQAQQLIAAQPL